MATAAARVRPGRDVLYRELGGEAVLLDVASGAYFRLNEVGARIWALIAAGNDMAAIAATLAAEFDAPEERIRADLAAIVDELASRSLVELERI